MFRKELRRSSRLRELKNNAQEDSNTSFAKCFTNSASHPGETDESAKAMGEPLQKREIQLGGESKEASTQCIPPKRRRSETICMAGQSSSSTAKEVGSRRTVQDRQKSGKPEKAIPGCSNDTSPQPEECKVSKAVVKRISRAIVHESDGSGHGLVSRKRKKPTDEMHQTKSTETQNDENWTEKSEEMKMNLRHLQRENWCKGDQIVQKAFAFVAKVAKDRTTEMTERESLEALVVFEESIKDDLKKKKRGKKVASEIIEEKHLEKCEKDSSGEEDEWEEVQDEDSTGIGVGFSVHIDLRTDKKLPEADWRSRWIRTEVNRVIRGRIRHLHQVHLLSFACHLKTVAVEALLEKGLLLSIIHPFPGSIRAVEKLFHRQFKQRMEEGSNDSNYPLIKCIEKRAASNEKTASQIFFAFASAAGFISRICCNCRLLPPAHKTHARSANAATVRYYWNELWDEETKIWKFVDPLKDFDSPTALELPLSHSSYILAVDSEYGIRDVTPRYIDPSLLISAPFRFLRVESAWLKKTLNSSKFHSNGGRAKKEDEEFESSLQSLPIPTTVAAFKNHPVYVLDKDLLLLECIYPLSLKPIGEIKSYKIYRRSSVRPLNTKNAYERMGRQIKEGEEPVKLKRTTNPIKKQKLEIGLFGFWQTLPWDGGEVQDGRLPRNEFGNVYLFQPSMCPRGAVHIKHPRLAAAVAELGFDSVPAVVGWSFRRGVTLPIIDGAVYIREDVPALMKAFFEYEENRKKDELEERSRVALSAWRRFILGSVRLNKLRQESRAFQGVR